MPNIIQNSDGSQDWQGTDAGSNGYVVVSSEYVAASVDKVFFVAPRQYIVKSIRVRPTVVGSDAGAVTAAIKKAASATAITAGTALHTGTADLKGTADTPQSLTLEAAANLIIPAGTCIGVDFTGTLTAATGVITIGLAPA